MSQKEYGSQYQAKPCFQCWSPLHPHLLGSHQHLQGHSLLQMPADLHVCNMVFINIFNIHVYRIAGKFGVEINLAILYWTAKFKSANMFAIAIWDPMTKFNFRQYFRLYGIMWVSTALSMQYHRLHLATLLYTCLETTKILCAQLSARCTTCRRFDLML